MQLENVFCCGQEIRINSPNKYECGHVLSVKNGGSDRLCNLRPICVSCNRSMSSEHMRDYMIYYGYDKTNVKCFNSLSFINWDEPLDYRIGMVKIGITEILGKCENKTVPEDLLIKIENLLNS